MKHLKRVKEVEFIETVGQLRAALADIPDDMPVFDGLDEPIMLTFWRDLDDGSEFVEVE